MPATLDDLMNMMEKMRMEGEKTVKESDARTSALFRSLEGNITQEIKTVNVTLASHTASLTSLEARMSAVESENAAWPTPGGSLGSGAFSAPSTASGSKRTRLDDSWISSNYSNAFATSEKTNIARLSGFPHLYTKTDLIAWSKEILTNALPDSYTLDVQAGGAAKSARIVFETSEHCANAIEQLKNKELEWKDPDDGSIYPIYFKHDSAPELRRMGGLLSTAWKAFQKICSPIAESIGHSFTLVTDKKMGLLRMKLGHRVLTILTIDIPTTKGPAEVSLAEDTKGFPVWLDMSVLQKVVAMVKEDNSFA